MEFLISPPTLLRMLAITGLLLAVETPASATLTSVTLFNNTAFSNLPSSLGSLGWQVAGTAIDFSHVTSEWVAAEFTPSISAGLTAIDVYMQGGNTASSGFSNLVTFEIYSDLNGAPGSQIGGSWQANVASASSNLIAIQAGGVNFTANKSYWLVAIPTNSNTVITWTADMTPFGPYALGFNKAGVTSWSVNPASDDLDPYFAIQGQVAEPRAIQLVFVGLMSLVIGRFRGRG